MLEHAHEEAMRRGRAIARMTQTARDKSRAGDIGVEERARRAGRSKPVDVLDIAQPDFRAPPPVPVAMDADEHIVRIHRTSLSLRVLSERRDSQ
jgi:hypothetical protein